jgi:uncharacterized protein (DUF885 family)
MDEITTLADEFQAYLERTQQMEALWKGDLTYLEEWEDFTAEGVAARRETLRQFAARARAVEEAEGSHPTLDLVAHAAMALDAEMEFYHDLQAVNSALGFHPMVLTFLPRYPLVTAEHGERYLVKLHNLVPTLAAFEERLGSAATRGRVPIRTIVQQTIAGLGRHLSTDPDEDPLLGQAPPSELDDEASAVWKSALRDVVVEEIRPAWKSLRSTVENVVLPAAPPDERAGLTYYEGGNYDDLILGNVTRSYPAQEIHDIGLAQIERLEDEYRQVAGPLLGTTDVGEIYARLREDPDLHYKDPDTLVADATQAIAKASEAMGDWFGVLPQAPCVATSIDQGPLAFYSQPSQNGSRPGTFFFNTADPSMWGTFQLEATAYHEGIPGHHLQVALTLENEDLHDLHKQPLSVAYLEGWALYTERLADEMGLYSSEMDRVGMLAADSMRACRLVVDTGLHALGWSREQAITYMVDHSPMTRKQVEGEIDRYIGNPGQALGYMMGRLEIEKIRQSAKERLGDRFDIKAFHDVVLGHGDVPLGTLERLVGDWIRSQD